MEQRDLSIIAQNAGATAAALVAAADNTDKTPLDLVEDFVAVREVVFNNTLELAGTNRDAVLDEIDQKAAARVEKAFKAGNAPPDSGGRVKVLKPLEGHPIPDWLEDQVEALIAEGKIPDTPVVEVWDNRKFLTRFGGDRDKGNWFATKWKPAGDKYGVSIWPPREEAA